MQRLETKKVSKFTLPMQSSPKSANVVAFLWQRKAWWLLPLLVLVLMVAIIFVLARLSSADTEMYPTTSWMRVPSLYLG